MAISHAMVHRQIDHVLLLHRSRVTPTLYAQMDKPFQVEYVQQVCNSMRSMKCVAVRRVQTAHHSAYKIYNTHKAALSTFNVLWELGHSVNARLVSSSIAKLGIVTMLMLLSVTTLP